MYYFFSYTRGDKGPNPFAKKVQENATNSNNPFLRNSGASKSMTRSESFFDKVNAIEEESEANKSQRIFSAKVMRLQRILLIGGKKLKNGAGVGSNTKQTTLFGLPPGKKEARTKGLTEMPSSQVLETQVDASESQITLVADESAKFDAVEENSQALTEMADDEVRQFCDQREWHH